MYRIILTILVLLILMLPFLLLNKKAEANGSYETGTPEACCLIRAAEVS